MCQVSQETVYEMKIVLIHTIEFVSCFVTQCPNIGHATCTNIGQARGNMWKIKKRWHRQTNLKRTSIPQEFRIFFWKRVQAFCKSKTTNTISEIFHNNFFTCPAAGNRHLYGDLRVF